MKSHIIRRRSERGDTIVEVLLAIAVISTVLAGAFGVTQKSAQAVRDSQEHAEVLELLQGQVEMVRSAALKAKSTTDPIFTSSPFCMDQTSGSIITGAACTNVPPDNLYSLSDTYNAATNTFTFTGQWPTITGNTGNEQLVYRVYPGQ